MKKIICPFENTPVIEDITSLPVPGSYYAVITDCETKVIEPSYKDQDTCLVVHYRLIQTDTLEIYDFTETFYPYKSNARTDDFLTFLKCHGYDFTSDDEIIGLRATVEVIYEFVGGYMHPVISYRSWGLSHALEHYSNEK